MKQGSLRVGTIEHEDAVVPALEAGRLRGSDIATLSGSTTSVSRRRPTLSNSQPAASASARRARPCRRSRGATQTESAADPCSQLISSVSTRPRQSSLSGCTMVSLTAVPAARCAGSRSAALPSSAPLGARGSPSLRYRSRSSWWAIRMSGMSHSVEVRSST